VLAPATHGPEGEIIEVLPYIAPRAGGRGAGERGGRSRLSVPLEATVAGLGACGRATCASVGVTAQVARVRLAKSS